MISCTLLPSKRGAGGEHALRKEHTRAAKNLLPIERALHSAWTKSCNYPKIDAPRIVFKTLFNTIQRI